VHRSRRFTAALVSIVAMATIWAVAAQFWAGRPWLPQLTWISPAQAATARAAVASNFIATAGRLAKRFSTDTGHTIALTSGATGQLHAQVLQGAPFDILLAADQTRPADLVTRGLVAKGGTFTYARGALVLAERPAEAGGPTANLSLADRLQRLAAQPKALAIANPQTAPYGRAARDILSRLNITPTAPLVQGINIAQTFQFVAQGLVPAGLIAKAQADQLPPTWRTTAIPGDWHGPINQDAALLARAQDNPAAVAFMTFLRGPRAAEMIAADGYSTKGRDDQEPSVKP